MMVKFLYAMVVVLVLVAGWQMLAHYRINHYLESASPAQAHGVAAGAAKVTVVAFMDYTCRPCKDANPAVLQIVEDNADTRVIFHPLPQNTALSQRVARFALAAAAQGRFVEMHEELMRNERPLTDAVFRDIAERLQLDYAQLERDAQSDAVTARLGRVLAVSQALGVLYTPTFIINRDMMYTPEQIESVYGDLSQLIKQARS